MEWRSADSEMDAEARRRAVRVSTFLFPGWTVSRRNGPKMREFVRIGPLKTACGKLVDYCERPAGVIDVGSVGHACDSFVLVLFHLGLQRTQKQYGQSANRLSACGATLTLRY